MAKSIGSDVVVFSGMSAAKPGKDILIRAIVKVNPDISFLIIAPVLGVVSFNLDSVCPDAAPDAPFALLLILADHEPLLA
ncbi:MAG: hypothetical protein HQK99_15960 [Nitrospirae bacterium]|nr:hypothetical protein [Nitrospirota bacterium]